jgi:TPR repeat protein
VEAYYTLGICYLDGLGVAKSYENAFISFSKCYELGNNKSIPEIIDLKSLLKEKKNIDDPKYEQLILDIDCFLKNIK